MAAAARAGGAPITTTTYRNDRIEIDVDWAAPTTGETTAKYIVTVAIHRRAWSDHRQGERSDDRTDVDQQQQRVPHLASKKAFTSVIAQSAAGRNSDTVTGLPVTIAQLPAPAKPTSYTSTMSSAP